MKTQLYFINSHKLKIQYTHHHRFQSMLNCFSTVQLFVTLWTVAHQAPLSIGISQARKLDCVTISASGGSFQVSICVSYVSCICKQVIYDQCHFSWFSSVSHIQLFVTQWSAVCQASLSITNSWSLLKLMSIELVMPSNHLIPFSSHLQIFPASGSFPMSQLFTSGGQNIGVSTSASVLPVNIQD